MATLAETVSADGSGSTDLRMGLTQFSNESGSMVDAMHDTKFTLKKNNNMLWMDTVSLLLDMETDGQKILKNKVQQYDA